MFTTAVSVAFTPKKLAGKPVILATVAGDSVVAARVSVVIGHAELSTETVAVSAFALLMEPLDTKDAVKVKAVATSVTL
jgi:hypothetical protein